MVAVVLTDSHGQTALTICVLWFYRLYVLYVLAVLSTVPALLLTVVPIQRQRHLLSDAAIDKIYQPTTQVVFEGAKRGT